MKPLALILSAPSGGGKTTIARALLASRSDVGSSVSCTTRDPRPGEMNGRDYHFWSAEQFEAGCEKGEFVEYAIVHGNRYGTLRREVERVLDSGRNLIMAIDVQGARQFIRAFPETVLVFLLPPSVEVLLDRLRGRKSEDPASFQLRLRTAEDELKEVSWYHYVVVNDVLEQAVHDVAAILDGERLRRATPPLIEGHTAQLVTALENELRQSMSTTGSN